MSDQCAGAEAEEGEEEGGGREGDREAEHDLDQFAHAAAGLSESQRQACQGNDDHGDDAGNRAFDRLQDLVERTFPGPAACAGPAISRPRPMTAAA